MLNQNNLKKLCDNLFDAYELPWDTNYFGVLSAKTVLKDSLREQDFVRLIDFLGAFDFVTIINADNKHSNNYWLDKNTSAFLVDINVQFVKNLASGCIKNVEPSEVFETCRRDESVLRLSRDAFKYSRFFNDPNLPADKAKGIYVQWTENAFNKPGRYFSIAKRQGVVAGFLLFSIDTDSSVATVELIAVDEQFRGLQVGKTLISGMEGFICQKNIKKIKVGTQIDNVSAIEFYMLCGFNYAKCNTVYHYWPNKLTSKGQDINEFYQKREVFTLLLT